MAEYEVYIVRKHQRLIVVDADYEYEAIELASDELKELEKMSDEELWDEINEDYIVFKMRS